MAYCKICDIINNPKTLDDTIIYENNFIIVKVAKGMVESGHLLVIPKEHVNGMADYDTKKVKEIYDLCSKIAIKLREETNKEVVLFEHGSLEIGRHPESIVHAHTHIITHNFTEESKNKIITGCKLNRMNNLEKLQMAKHQDYWFFEDNEKNMYMSYNVKDVARSIIFKVIAEENGLESDYEWRDEKNNDVIKVQETLDLGYKVLKKII